METDEYLSTPHLKKYRWLPKTRKNAFLGHLLISVTIFIALAAIIYWGWFPGALFFGAGGIDGIKIVAAVDLVLGPMLMLIIYNPLKSIGKIIFDLCVIFSVQFGCLIAGVYVVYQERPVAVTYVDDKFYALKLKQFKKDEDRFFMESNLHPMKPEIFYVRLPEDAKSKATILVFYQTLKSDLTTRTALYEKMPLER
ncbi:MAG: hypothetical protein OQJ89_09050 [Kangiellaceae bacterium]|nr:hypothetical protein [Kangiellaceae bacterium]MCW9001004.1 hypothetical protein [Kangiellaceae bacterium]MCW9017098.1 hypothetical protein [Kangiellaceae bacterium]